jgi:uncharacterized protein YjcR
MQKQDVSVKITKQDKALLDNLTKILGRAKIELVGVEILVAADAMRWLSRFQKQIEIEDTKPPINVVTTEVEKSIEPQKVDKPKKSKKVVE